MTIGRQYTPNLTRQRTDVHAQIATLLKKLDDPVVKNKLAIKEPDSGLGIVKVLDGKTLRTNLIKIRDQKLHDANHEDIKDIMRTLHGYDKAIGAVKEFSKFK